MNVFGKTLSIVLLCAAQLGIAHAQTSTRQAQTKSKQPKAKDTTPALTATEAKLVGVWVNTADPEGQGLVFGKDRSYRTMYPCGFMQVKMDAHFGGRPLGTWLANGEHQLVINTDDSGEKDQYLATIDARPDGALLMRAEGLPPEADQTFAHYQGTYPLSCKGPDKAEEEAWNEAGRVHTIASYNDYLARFRFGHYVPAAVDAIKALRDQPGQLAVKSNDGIAFVPKSYAPDISFCVPAYPEHARQALEDGRVQLRLKIEAKGKPLQIDITHGSGFDELDQAAVTMLQHCAVEPRTLLDGTPIVGYFKAEYVWNLTD